MNDTVEKFIPQSQLKKGEVALIGAGPGDPELLTIRAARFIEQAEVVVHDRLVSDEILNMANPNCKKFYVGKSQAKHCVPQSQINEMLAIHALEGKKVVRLKGGDPFIFGRGGEEAEFLLARGVSCHVVPGITAASGCTTYAGIPLTHRGIARACTFITGHMQNDGELDLPWQNLSCSEQTIAFYMGLNTLPTIVDNLIEHGMDERTPAAIIRNGTRADQQVYRGTLDQLSTMVIKNRIRPPALVVVGHVVDIFAEGMAGPCGYLKSPVTLDHQEAV